MAARTFTLPDSPRPQLGLAAQAAVGISSEVPRWFVLHTKSRQEKALADDLSPRGLDVFLPLVREVRYYGRRKFRVEIPLFPGYLFLRGTAEQSYIADRTDRVASIIRVSDQAGLDHELSQIRAVVERDGHLRPRDPLVNGTHVEVKSGPFKGIRGVVERDIPNDRLILQVAIIGQGSELEIDRSLLVAVT